MTRSTHKQSAPVCEHICIKEADLGRLDARIDGNEKTGEEIKATLNRLVDSHETDKQSTNQQFSKVTSEISKISTTLAASAQTNKELLDNQNKLLEKLNTILLDKHDILNAQQNLADALNAHIELTNKRHANTKEALNDIRNRLTKLEQHRHTIVSIGALIISLLTAVGLLAQIYQVLGK